MESLSLPTFVQCLGVELPGNTCQEWMPLKPSEKSGERIKIQLRPFELIRLGPFHLTFVAAKDALEPPISNFYRLEPGVESRDHQQAVEPLGVKEQPVGPEMLLDPTSYSTTSFDHPVEHVITQSRIDACQGLAASSSVMHDQYSEPVMDILEPNSDADAKTHAQLDSTPEDSPNDAVGKTGEESGGKVCHDIDTQDSMLPSIQIKTPAPSLNDMRDTTRVAGAGRVNEVSLSPPQASPPSDRKRKRSISPSSRPPSPVARMHSSNSEAADGVMHEHKVSDMAHPPPETSPVSEQKKKKRSVSPLSRCQSPIKHMQSNGLEASDEGVTEHGETEVARSPIRITPPSEGRKKRKVARFSISETAIKSTRPRDPTNLQASGELTGGPTLRVLFASSSTIDESSAYIRFLREKHVQVVKDVRRATVLCIGCGGFKKTSKFIMAVLLGVPITTDEWVLQSVQAGILLPVNEFLARDSAREAEWEFDLGEAVLRAKRGHKVFASWTIIFTAAAKKSAAKKTFDELKSLALAAGAQNVFAADAKKIADQGNETSRLLILAATKDPAVPQLGVLKCFSQDIIGTSILRGVLDTSSDEFLQK